MLAYRLSPPDTLVLIEITYTTNEVPSMKIRHTAELTPNFFDAFVFDDVVGYIWVGSDRRYYVSAWNYYTLEEEKFPTGLLVSVSILPSPSPLYRQPSRSCRGNPSSLVMLTMATSSSSEKTEPGLKLSAITGLCYRMGKSLVHRAALDIVTTRHGLSPNRSTPLASRPAFPIRTVLSLSQHGLSSTSLTTRTRISM